MGNSSGCCTSGNGAERCCNKKNKEALGAPITGEPLPSSEVVGIETREAPGLNSKAELGNDSTGAVKDRGVAGGDSAAGGDPVERQTMQYIDGSTYVGQMEDSKRHGQGIWQSNTGQYDGQWQGDVQHGKGRQTWVDGRVYDGQFEFGKFAGTGRMVWNTPKGLLTYEGEYKEDLKHGTGKFVWADGRSYDGEWQFGKRHGRGMYTNARLEQKVGYWLNDKFDRWENQPDESGTKKQDT